jgi:hypothetical protein
VNSFDHLRQALTFVMPPKKITAPGAATLQPLDPNQESLSLREARSQKRKATSPTFQEEELDQEIRDMEIIHQQVQRKKEKMARLADLQRKIDEATEEVCHFAQDEQDRRPQHRELRQEGLFNEDGWYDDFNHDTFTFDDASLLAAELQAIPWPQSYKPPQLPMYDGHSDPKQFLMSYEATISSYGGNTAIMAKSFVMCRRFETGGSLGRRVKCRCVPQPRWVGARPSAKGGRKVAKDRRERGGNPAAFVFVPRPGRVRLQ